MSCKNCKFLKIKNLTYSELEARWDELCGPKEITPGYRLKFLNASRQYKYPINKTRLKFMYCSKGVLTRFYIIRNGRSYGPKKSISFCRSYA